MAMADCGDDEFGDIYADISVVDADALRGFGSVCWYEEDSDVSASCPHGHSPPALAQCKINASGCSVDAVELCNEGTPSQAMSSAQSGSEQADPQGTGELTPCSKGDRLAEGADTDSDDDLHIVLNPHQSLKKGDGEGSGEDSGDGEDFVVLTGNDHMDNAERREGREIPANDRAQSHLGEKLLGDDKGQHAGAYQGPPHIGYSGQAYRRHYKYVRGSGLGRAGATPSVGARYIYLENGYRKGDMLGSGRGFTKVQRGSASTWGARTPRGFSNGLEYTLPSNKTVFDIDVDALEEKPWRLPKVDVSDYFNFGMNENSWKEYCKQLAQFCLENTSHRKIQVYEGGRGEQSMLNVIQIRGEGSSFALYKELEQIRDSDAILLLNVSDHQSGNEDHEGKGTDIAHDSSDVERGVGIKKAQSTAPQSTEEGGKGLRKKLQEIQNVASFLREGRNCVPAPPRPKKTKPSTGSGGMLLRGKRETEKRKGTMFLQGKRNMFNLEKDTLGALQQLNVVGRQETLQHKHSAPVSKARRSLKVSVESKISEQVFMKMEGNMAHVSKKQRLGSFSVTQVSHHGSQAMKKSLKARIARALLRVRNSETIQDRKHSSIINTCEQYSDVRIGVSSVNGLNGHDFVEKHVMQGKSTSKKLEAKRLKAKSKSDSIEVLKEPPVVPSVQADEQSKVSVKGTNGSIKVSNGLLDTPHVCAEDSKPSLKRKRSKKGCKHKGKSKSKDKVHLPGCPHLARRQAEGHSKGYDENQGIRCVNMNGIVCNDADDWKEGAQDVVEKSLSFSSHSKGKSKEKNVPSETNGCHFETGGKGDDNKGVSKLRVGISFDGHYVEAGADGREILKKEVVHPWKMVHILTRKKEEVACVLSRKMVPTVEDSNLLLHSCLHTVQAALSDQLNVGEKTKHKRKKKKVKKLQPEAEQEANGFSGHRKKQHVKKLNKHSSEHNHQPDTTGLVHKMQEVKASALAARDPSNSLSERNARSTSLMDAQEGNAYERMVHFDRFQTKFHSSKACNTEQQHQHPSIIPVIGNGCDVHRSNSNEMHLGKSKGHGFDGGNELDRRGCRANGNEVHTGTSNGHGYDHGFVTGGCNVNGLGSSRLVENHPVAEGPTEVDYVIVPGSDSSDEDEKKQRGRSKFERWTSHSEQVRDDVCVGSIGNGNMQRNNRIDLSKSLQAGKIGQCIGSSDGYTGTQGGPNGAGLESRRTWKVGRKQNRRLNGSLHGVGDHGMNGCVVQQSIKQNHDQFTAKLEKRRERFKLSAVEENESLQSTGKNIGLADRVNVRTERPARKRSWGGG